MIQGVQGMAGNLRKITMIVLLIFSHDCNIDQLRVYT